MTEEKRHHDIKVISHRVSTGVGSIGRHDVIEINGVRFDAVTDLRLETGPEKFRIATMSFLVRNIEWVLTDDMSGEWVTGDV